MAFLTNKAAKEKIETLESRVDELETDLSARDEHIESQDAIIVERDATIAENSATITTLTEERDKFKNESEQLASDLKESKQETADAKESAGKQATELLASAGQPEPLKVEEAASATAETKTREEFNAMDHPARNAFIAGGGKIK